MRGVYKKQIQGVQQQNGTECDIRYSEGFDALKFAKDLNIREGTPLSKIPRGMEFQEVLLEGVWIKNGNCFFIFFFLLAFR